MARKASSYRSPRRRLALWQLGLLMIVAALVSNVVSPLVMTALPPPSNQAEAMGRAFGRGLAVFLCVITGVVLIIVHFVRRARR